MNYGYESLGNEKDKELAEALDKMIKAFGEDSRGLCPYVEIRDGVRIRRLTHFGDDVVDQIVERADSLFERVR